MQISFNDIYTCVSQIYTISKPITSFIVNKHKEKQIDNAVDVAINDQVEVILKENVQEILVAKEKEIKSKNYVQVLDYEFKEKMVADIINRNNNLRIYRSDIEEYIQGFIDSVLAYLKGKADNQRLLETVIDLNHMSERNADVRRDDIKKEIKSVIYMALSERKGENNLQLKELPFEVDTMNYVADVYNGEIVHEVKFALSKSNYKVKLDDIYVATESKKGLWVFENYVYSWRSNYTTNLQLRAVANARGIRKIESSGIVVFFKVYDRTSYYMRIFGNTENLYYEQLTEKEYESGRAEYKAKYKDATKINSTYEDWRKYFISIMYTDFGM